MSSLATLIRTWRERALLTQEQLAHRTGLGVRTIRRLESGGLRRPRRESVRLLVDALALSDVERARFVAAARGESGPTIPRQLPADVKGFTGRTRDLHELDRALTRGSLAALVITAIAGTAGVGKTALAVHWAHRVARRFPDGQLYLNLRGFDPGGTPTDPAVAVRSLLAALDVPPQRLPSSVDAQVALYRSLLADRRMLVVLDNAVDAEQVRPLLPGAPGCLALVTSRNSLAGLVAGEGARALTLDLLSTVEARELLARRIGTDRTAKEPDAVDEIVVSCARLPLALAVAAARAATAPDLPLAYLASELRSLDGLGTGDPATDVRAVFSWSYQSLGPAAAGLFRLLGLHPGPDVSVPAAASLAGVPPSEVRPLLAELTRSHLVAETHPHRFSLHDLLRAYAGELARAPEREAAVRRMLDHYLHSSHAATQRLNPHRDSIVLDAPEPGTTPEEPMDYEAAMAWFDVERPVLLSAVDRAAVDGLHTLTWQLAWTLSTFLYRRGHWHDWVAVQRAAVTATQQLADSPAQARAHRLLANAYVQIGRFADAQTELRQALDLHRAAGDQIGRAHTHHNLAQVCERQGNYTEALGHAQQALDVYRVADHRTGQANSLNAVGWFHALIGDYPRALAACQESLDLHRALDNGYGQAATFDSLGYVHHLVGDHDQAISCYEQALELERELGDRYIEATTLAHLGDAHCAAGRAEAARTAWRHAVSILDAIDHPDADAVRAKLVSE